MHYRKTVIIILVGIFLVSNAFEDLGAQDVGLTPDSTYKNRVLVLPAIGSSPETGFMFGGLVVPQFKVGDAGPETRSSSILISAIYTVKNQLLASFAPDIIFPQEQWVLNGNHYYYYFPESFWGVGPYTKNEDEITALFNQVNLEQSALRKVESGVYSGPYIRWRHVYGVSYEDKNGEPISMPAVDGAEGFTSSGVGWISRLDKRNSNMTPTRNHYVEFSFLANTDWLGSTDPYTSYKIDARKYLDLDREKDGSSVLAFQSILRLTSGDPPFRDLSMLGGDVVNRGYYQGRYRDQNAAQVQAELRQNVIGRLGFTLFAGSGEVWDRFADFKMDNFKWTAGGGLRFNINPDDPTNIRVDFGFGKETSGFYLQFGEAF